MAAESKDFSFYDEEPDENAWFIDDGTSSEEVFNVLAAALSQSDKKCLVEDVGDTIDLVLDELKAFGRRKAGTLQDLRDEIDERFDRRFDIAGLDDRLRKFLDKELKPRKQKKRKRSPSSRRKSVPKKKARKSSATKKKGTKKKTTKKKKQTKKKTSKKKGKRKTKR